MSKPVPEWSQQEADAYRLARDILTEVIAALDARIDAEQNAAVAEELNSRWRDYVEKKRTLSVLDQAEARRIIGEYPALLHRIRVGES